MRIFQRKKKEKKKNPFVASMPLDNPDIKIVEARYADVPFFIGVGTSKRRGKRIVGGVEAVKLGGKGEYQAQKELEWRIYINPTALPEGFMPEEKLKDWVAGTVSGVSGSMDVFSTSTKYEEALPQDVRNLLFGKPNSRTVDNKTIDDWWKRESKDVRAIIEDFIKRRN